MTDEHSGNPGESQRAGYGGGQTAQVSIAGDSSALVRLSFPDLPVHLHAADCEGGYAFLQVDVEVAVPGFSARRRISMVPQDLLGFLSPLRESQLSVSGEPTLTTLEDEFALKLAYAPNGLVGGDGYLRDHSAGNSLAFVINTDQTFLNETLEQLEDLCARFEGF
ncbi:hypothetical protein IT575_09080 [bacterium]|nr:hypothetical protein [bacterium]